MPRANRYFLPGHVWHITHQYSSPFQWFDTLTMNGILDVQSLRSVQNVQSRTECIQRYGKLTEGES
jgi:hypothetical protein